MVGTYLLVISGIFLGVGQTVEASRILAFLPFPAKSHQAAFTPILKELATRGHEIVAYVPYQMKDPPKTYKEVIIPNVLENLHDEVNILELGENNFLVQNVVIHQMGLWVQENILQLASVQELINSNEKFDVVILESYFVQEAFAGFQHRFNAIAIDILPMGDLSWLNDAIGKPQNPSYVVDYLFPYTDRMTFAQRLTNTLSCLTSSLYRRLYHLPKAHTVMDKYLNYPGSKERPCVNQLMANKSLVLTNSHYSLDYAYPSIPNVIEIGGIHIGPEKPLPKDLQTFMDGAKEGVIYFSLGSNINVSEITKGNVFDAFKNAFAKLKQKVLWKWEKGDLPDKPPNVKTSTWFPQQSILPHKNLKLFITHGGYLSLAEATYYGVPLICIPFFGDQPRNVRFVTNAGYGVQLDLKGITEEKVTNALQEILNNPKYKEKAMWRKDLFRDRPMKPLEEAIHWIEYVIKYKGADHLKSAAAFMPWYQTALLDVWAVIISAIMSVIILLYLMVSRFCRMICGSKRSKAKDVDKKKKKN